MSDGDRDPGSDTLDEWLESMNRLPRSLKDDSGEG